MALIYCGGPLRSPLGVIAMHSSACPSCGNYVEVDFLPVAGQVWCPICQKLFSPPPVLKPAPETKQVDGCEDRNGTAG
jgi:hypothetical protein